ncbi:Pre-mRNA-splicing factor cwf19 [Sporothrix bragantina]|uniref:Pre-mRNA-splicing factor cwf19 n=1 Tax=Sporothrix bragantina TaxID=671064 RepID=A0ABP0CWE5_9PEZI
MTKLRGVYSVAEQSGRSVEEVAIERFGSLKEFDEAREESSELERRRLYGQGYALKEKPTGDLYRERIAGSGSGTSKQRRAEDDEASSNDGDDINEVEKEETIIRRQLDAPVDQTALNRLRAALIKAKLRKAPEVAEMEKEYEEAAAAFAHGSSNAAMERAVVLDASHSRLLAGTRAEVQSIDTRRGKERGLVEANDNMTVEDMKG